MSSAEDGHQDAHAAEDERVEGAAQRPPGAQEQEDEEVNGRGQRGQRDACRKKNNTKSEACGFIVRGLHVLTSAHLSCPAGR